MTREAIPQPVTFVPNRHLKLQIAAWKNRTLQNWIRALCCEISWASSPLQATEAIDRLQGFVGEFEAFVTSEHLRKLRVSLEADDALWRDAAVREGLVALDERCEQVRTSLLARLDTKEALRRQAEKTTQALRKDATLRRKQLGAARSRVSALTEELAKANDDADDLELRVADAEGEPEEIAQVVEGCLAQAENMAAREPSAATGGEGVLRGRMPPPGPPGCATRVPSPGPSARQCLARSTAPAGAARLLANPHHLCPHPCN